MNIYKIENIKTKDCYIGSETNNNSRWRQHISRLRHNKHHSIYLQRGFNKYGEDNFTFILLETGITDNTTLLNREQFYIDSENSKYNMCKIAGNTKGITKTQEQKDKLAKISRILYFSNDKALKFTMKDKNHSNESKSKISLGNKNKLVTKETKLKMSLSKCVYKVCEYDIETLELIAIYPNICEASKNHRISTQKMKNYLNTKFGIFNGVILRYEHNKPIKKVKKWQ